MFKNRTLWSLVHLALVAPKRCYFIVSEVSPSTFIALVIE